MLNSSKYKVIYRTYAICPICQFLEKKSKEWVHSCVIVKNKKLWYIYKCPVHGQQELLYFSDMKYFFRMLKFTPGLLEEKTKKGVGDVEEIKSRVKYRSSIQNQPFLISFEVDETTSFESFKSLIENTCKQIYGENPTKNFFIKTVGKTNDVHKLNSLILQLLTTEIVKKNALLLELPFNKFSQMVTIEKTVLLNKSVYPCVKIYIEKGKELVNVKELESVFYYLNKIKNLVCIIKIYISRPFPDLRKILSLCRKQGKVCKFLVIEVERAPNQIKENLKINKMHFKERNEINLDICDLVKTICKGCDGIETNDFFPISTAMMAEQFLKHVGFGEYNLRPSPLCALGTILINSKEYKSVPINHFIDIEKLFQKLVPILKVSKMDFLTPNFYKASKFPKIINSCIRSNTKLKKVNIVDYLKGDDLEKAKQLKKIFDDAQVIVIHNNIDLGCVDFGRRSRCSSCYVRNNTVYSECIKCI